MSDTRADRDNDNGADDNGTAASEAPISDAPVSGLVANRPAADSYPMVQGNTANHTAVDGVMSLCPATPSRSSLSRSSTPRTGSVSDEASIWSSVSNRSEWGAKSVDPAVDLTATTSTATNLDVPAQVPWDILADILIHPPDEVAINRRIWPPPVFRVQVPQGGFPAGSVPALSVFVSNGQRILSPRCVVDAYPNAVVKTGAMHDNCLYFIFDSLRIEGPAPEGLFCINSMFYLQRGRGPPLAERRSRVRLSTQFRIIEGEVTLRVLTPGQDALYRSLEYPRVQPYLASPHYNRAT